MPDDWFAQNAPKPGGDWFAQNAKTAPPPSPPDSGTAAPNSVAGGFGRRLKGTAEGLNSLAWADLSPTEQGIDAATGHVYGAGKALAAAPGTILRGIWESTKQAEQQAKKQLDDANSVPSGNGNNLIKALMYGRALTTGLAALNPLASAAAVNVNNLEDEGRGREALGQGLADVAMLGLGSDTAQEAASTAKNAAKGIPESVRTGMQSYAGVGRGMTRKAVREEAEAFPDAQGAHDAEVAKLTHEHSMDLLKQKQKYEQQVRDAKQEHDAAVEKRGADVLKAKQKYEQQVRDAQEEHARAQQKAQEANRKALDDYRQKKADVEAHNAKVEGGEAGREAAPRRTRVLGRMLGERLRKLNDSLREQANQKYATVRAKVGSATVPRSNLESAVKTAEDKFIRGTPESIKQFKEITGGGGENPALTVANQTAKGLGYKNFDAMKSADPNYARYFPEEMRARLEAGGKPLSFNDLQGLREEIAAKRADGNLPGDVYKALEYVQDAIDAEMTGLAESKGAGQEFQDARDFYREYRQTFHDPTGPSGSGSPVAQALQAEDPERVAAPFLGDAGERGIRMLQKYDPEAASIALEMRRLKNQAEGLPKGSPKAVPSRPVPVKPPGGANLPLPPVLPPEVPGPSLPLPPVLPPDPVIPEFNPQMPDIAKMRRDSMWKGARALGSPSSLSGIAGIMDIVHGVVNFSGHEVGTGVGLLALRRFLAGRMESPSFVGWLEKPSMADLKELQKLPAPYQKEVAGMMQKYISEHPDVNVKVSPKVSAWVKGAAAAANTHPRKTVGELLQYGTKKRPSYTHTAVNNQGHRIGSNDGQAWFDHETGEPVQ